MKKMHAHLLKLDLTQEDNTLQSTTNLTYFQKKKRRDNLY